MAILDRGHIPESVPCAKAYGVMDAQPARGVRASREGQCKLTTHSDASVGQNAEIGVGYYLYKVFGKGFLPSLLRPTIFSALFYIRTMSFIRSAILAANVVILTCLPSLFARASTDISCRYMPGNTDWPITLGWTNLNATGGERHIRTVPPSSACYNLKYNAEQCSALKVAWPYAQTK